MREDPTHVSLESGALVVRRYQDAQDIADRAQMLREQPNKGDFHHKWSIPNVLVDQFYQRYCGDQYATAKPMNAEFWAWVNQEMKSSEYRVFWTHDKQNQFRVGYDGSRPRHEGAQP